MRIAEVWGVREEWRPLILWKWKKTDRVMLLMYKMWIKKVCILLHWSDPAVVTTTFMPVLFFEHFFLLLL